MIHRLRELWGEGHSTAGIGRRLGVSKNAVIGKARRLKLSARPSPISRAGPPRVYATKRVLPPKLADVMLAPSPPPASRVATQPRLSSTSAAPEVAAMSDSTRDQPPGLRQGSTRMPLDGQRCCWPIGEPGRVGFRFCDEPLTSRTPYCPEHARKAYVRRVDADNGLQPEPDKTRDHGNHPR